MRVHIGATKYPGTMQFHTATIIKRGKPYSDRFVRHHLRSMWGVSIGARLFVGFLLFDKTDNFTAASRVAPTSDAHGSGAEQAPAGEAHLEQARNADAQS